MILAFLLAALPPAIADQSITGPALVCGEAFALRLGPGERAVRHDPQIDFLTYRVEGPYGSFVLYEGNAPQPHDDEIQTGLSWPNVVAIHDNRNAGAKAAGRIRDRLLTGTARDALCPARRQ